MSQVFINPAPYGEMKYEDFKNVKLIAYPNSKLVAPYEGIISEPLNPPCKDFIRIEHNIENKVVYSLFCDVGKLTVSNRDKVRQGEMIGKFSDDKIDYFILDDNNKKMQIVKFFEEKVEPVKKEKDGKDKEEDKKEKEKNKDGKGKDGKDKEKNGDENKKKGRTPSGESGIENVFLDTLLLPFSLVHGGAKKITGDSEEKDKKLQEHINKIKKLIK